MVRADGRGREMQWRLPTPRLGTKPQPIPLPIPLEMITRAEWAAAPHIEQDSDIRLTLPIKHLRYTFTDTAECASQEECIPFLQQLQRESQENGYPDLMYNFLIGSDGMLYEGRGFDWKCTVFPDPWVDSVGESLNIAYIGSFHDALAPWQFRLTGKKLTKWMLENQFLKENFETTPAICWPGTFNVPVPAPVASVDNLDLDLTPDTIEVTEDPELPLTNFSEEAVVTEGNPIEGLQ